MLAAANDDSSKACKAQADSLAAMGAERAALGERLVRLESEAARSLALSNDLQRRLQDATRAAADAAADAARSRSAVRLTQSLTLMQPRAVPKFLITLTSLGRLMTRSLTTVFTLGPHCLTSSLGGVTPHRLILTLDRSCAVHRSYASSLGPWVHTPTLHSCCRSLGAHTNVALVAVLAHIIT